MIIDADCDWDEEAIDAAIKEAHRVEWHDPALSKQLMAQAVAAKEKLRNTPIIHEPYDPSALQARVLRGYQGGVTVRDLDTMRYQRFFGLVRELEVMLEQECDEYDKAKHGRTTSVEQGIAAINGEFGRPQEYMGETIKLI